MQKKSHTPRVTIKSLQQTIAALNVDLASIKDVCLKKVSDRDKIVDRMWAKLRRAEAHIQVLEHSNKAIAAQAAIISVQCGHPTYDNAATIAAECTRGAQDQRH